MIHLRSARHVLAALAFTALLACHRDTAVGADQAPRQPAAAVMQLADDLRRNDLAAYARHALPPELHEQVRAAWGRGQTLWPLTQLPLDRQVPGMLQALAAPDAERTLSTLYRRQFAGAHRELRAAASTMGLFAVQYVNGQDSYSEQEREHLVQLIAALSRWGQQAPLGDPALAEAALPPLVAAARATGLGEPGALAATGMTGSLERLGPFLAEMKRVLAGYGLDLDAALGSVQATLLEQTGDQARVRLRYTLAGTPVDAVVLMERSNGRWYPADAVRHARAQVAAAAAAPAPSAPGATPAPATAAPAPETAG